MRKVIASTKILTFFTITTLLFTFTACSSQNTTHQMYIQVHTSQNGVSCLLPEYGFYQPQLYKDLGYEKIYAITCLFSQKTVNELSSSLDT